MRGHAGAVHSAAFSLDGRRLLTASEDGTARIWDAASGAQLVRMAGQSGPLSSAAFSPDGTRVVTTSGDRTARVWDAATGRELARLEHGSRVYLAMFRPDGAGLVTASENGAVRLWGYGCELSCPLDRLRTFASRRITRELTPLEREQYLFEPRSR